MDDDDMEELPVARRHRGRASSQGAGDLRYRPNEYKRLRRLQDQDIENRLRNQSLSPAQERNTRS